MARELPNPIIGRYRQPGPARRAPDWHKGIQLPGVPPALPFINPAVYEKPKNERPRAQIQLQAPLAQIE